MGKKDKIEAAPLSFLAQQIQDKINEGLAAKNSRGGSERAAINHALSGRTAPSAIAAALREIKASRDAIEYAEGLGARHSEDGEPRRRSSSRRVRTRADRNARRDGLTAKGRKTEEAVAKAKVIVEGGKVTMDAALLVDLISGLNTEIDEFFDGGAPRSISLRQHWLDTVSSRLRDAMRGKSDCGC